VDAAVFTNSELGSSNGAEGNGGMKLSINLNGIGKLLLTWRAPNVEDVAAFWIAFEIEEVDSAFRVHSGLGLNAVVWGGDEFDVLAADESGTQKKKQESRGSVSVRRRDREFIHILGK